MRCVPLADVRRVLLTPWVLASLVACGGGSVTPPPAFLSPAALPGAVTGYPSGTVSDATISAVTERELRNHAATRSEAIGVASDAGVVVLRGSVTTLLAKRTAVELAQLVRGVRAVVDLIGLAAVPKPDGELQREAEAVLRRDPVTARQGLHIEVERGSVWLRGEVDSPAVHHAALQDLEAVPGIVAVADEVDVRRRRLPDGLLATAIRRRVTSDPWLGGSRVDVEARRGLVKLDGWVTCPKQRIRAQADAWTAAPLDVDARNVRVDAFADDGTLRGWPEVPRSDGDLEQSLLDAFVLDTRIHPFVPGIAVRNGVVLVSGVAPQAIVRAVDSDARNLPGARGVQNVMRTPREVPGQ